MAFARVLGDAGAELIHVLRVDHFAINEAIGMAGAVPHAAAGRLMRRVAAPRPADDGRAGREGRMIAPAPSSAAAPVLELHGVTKRFGELVAIEDLTFAVSPGEFVAIVGPSGSGKSTILSLIAGLDRPS